MMWIPDDVINVLSVSMNIKTANMTNDVMWHYGEIVKYTIEVILILYRFVTKV